MQQLYSNHIWTGSCPILGRLHFVKDTAGIIQLSFIVWYWIYGSSVTLFLIVIPRYKEGIVPLVGLVAFCTSSIMTITSLFKAATTNPGRVPLVDEENLKPDQFDWSQCKVCLRRRPLRSHHCRRCKQCVLKMDHHCPWINNCVGEENHYLFMQLCFWAFILSLFTFIECLLHFYFYPKCTVCDYSSWFFYHQRALLYVDTTLGFLMSTFMLCMLCTQHMNLMLDRTTFENMWDPFPKELPRQKRPAVAIYADLCGPGSKMFWLFPCRQRVSAPVYKYYSVV